MKHDFPEDYDITQSIAGKKLMERELEQELEQEEEDKYHPMPHTTMQLDDTFPGTLNFQYSFADGGTGQDWVVSISLFPYIIL